MDRDEDRDAAEASIPGEQHDVVNASRRDHLRAALFDAPPPERRVGRFVVRGVLGRGGMGTVLEAFDEVLDRPVAIKLLHPTLAHREERLIEEARALARLSHPHVVQVYEAGKAGNRVYLVMELVRGQTLRQWQDAAHPGWRACVEAYVQAGRGLASAHAHGLVHRDFKPSNCIRDAQGRVRVLDFGLVRRGGGSLAGDSDVGPLVSGQDEATQPGPIVGTPAYMAPELLRDEPADAKSDQYAFCVALYEALLGRHPFGPEGPARREAMAQGRVLAAAADPRVPAWIRGALVRGLRSEPAARWPSMDALVHAIDPARRVGRRAWQVVVAAGLMGAGGLHAVVSRPSPCRAEAPRRAALWSEARREAVHAGLVASGSPLAEPTWVRVEPQVDAYLQRWDAAHREVCEATRVRGEQSEVLMDQRMACLELRLDAFASLSKALEHADGEIVVHALHAVLRLPTPDPCITAAEGNARPEAMALEKLLVALSTSLELGRPSVAEPLDTVRQQALDAGLDGVAARALGLRGRDEYYHGRIAAADATLEAAIWAALAVGEDQAALRAMLDHLQLVGLELVDPTRALPRVEQSRALLRRVGEPPELRVHWLTVAANVLARHGRIDDARALLDDAMAATEALPDPRRAYGDVLNATGGVAQLAGRSQEAREAFERLLAHERAVYGERHPVVAAVLNNLAVVDVVTGERERARQWLREALDIRRAALGPSHPDVADTTMNLAGAIVVERPTEALALVEEARSIYAATLGEAAAKTVAAELARGRTVEMLGRRDEAEQIYREVLARQRQALGASHPDLVPTLRALRELLLATERQAEAEELQGLVTAIERKAGVEAQAESR